MFGTGSLIFLDSLLDMRGAGSLLLTDFDILFQGESSLSFHSVEPVSGSLIITGASNCEFNGTTDYGRAFLPSIGGQGFDEDSPGYGSCSVFLPSLFAHGYASAYIPAEPQFGLGFLPQPYGFGHMVASSSGEANVTMPALMAIGGEGDYGYGNALLPALMASGVDDFAPKTAFIFSSVRVQNGMLGVSDHIVFIGNNGLITGTITATRQAVESFIERLSLSSDFSVIGAFYILINEQMSVLSELAGQLDGKINFDETSRVWVVNMDTGASSQYDNYGFNSFFERDGIYYGIADDGIYKLDGDNDVGVGIDSVIEIGKSNYETYKIKSSQGIYIGCSSTGKIFAKVVTERMEKIYEMSFNSTTLQIQKIPISYKHIGSEWNVIITNDSGCDFNIADIDFKLVITTRRSI